ncbi:MULTISPECIES: hypothetical protein [Kordiimonas]|uniref:hypothetical protein n=1 Tax=Kordiimonas TaxID=288021 RepID=UPI00257E67C4|nr:hypothetical protein [Kordiimonas sp. UBA4487]
MSTSHEYKSRLQAFGLLAVLAVLFLLSEPSNAQTQVFYVNADRNIEKGQEAMNEGDYDRAVRYLRKAAQRDLASEHMAIVQNSLCASLFLKGSYEEATSACSSAIAEDARYWKAYVNRGHARKALGDASGALADYCQAHALSPSHVTGPFRSQCEG